MSKELHNAKTQGVKHVQYHVTAQSTGAANPILGEGDSLGYYVQVQRGATGTVAHGFTGAAGGPTGMTGVYVIRPTDKFAAVVDKQVSLEFAAPPKGYHVEFFPSAVDSDGHPCVSFMVCDDNAAVDLAVGDRISFTVVFRNSTANVVP